MSYVIKIFVIRKEFQKMTFLVGEVPQMTYLVTRNDISGHSLETRNDISCCSLATINDISGRSLATRNDISGRSIATRNHISGHSVVGGGGLMVPCVFL